MPVENSEKFQTLKRRHRSFVFPLAIAFLLWYFAYVLLAEYAPEFMSRPVWGNINIGLLLGLGQFVSTFAITVWYANHKIDPPRQRDSIRARVQSRSAPVSAIVTAVQAATETTSVGSPILNISIRGFHVGTPA